MLREGMAASRRRRRTQRDNEKRVDANLEQSSDSHSHVVRAPTASRQRARRCSASERVNTQSVEEREPRDPSIPRQSLYGAHLPVRCCRESGGAR